MATKQRRVSLAFAGPGETTFDNAKALLNDFLGFGPEDDEGFPEIPEERDLDLQIYLPATEEHLTDGIGSVIDWLDYADLAYDTFVNGSTSRAVKRVTTNAENNIKAKNVNDALINALREDAEDGAEAYLVLLWGEEGDDNAEILLDLASSYHLRALDLTQGLDDLDFGDQPTPHEPEPTPEAEPEKPVARRRRNTTKKSEPEPEKAPEPTLEEQVATAARARKVAEPKTQSQDEPEGDDIVALAQAFYSAVETTLADGLAKTQALLRLQEATFWTTAALDRDGLAKQPEKAPQEPQKPATRRRSTKAAAPAPEPEKEPEKPAEAAPRRGRGRPRKDGTPAQPRTPEDRAIVQIWDDDEDGWVNAGRGRIPKGIPTRKVDPKTGEVVSEDPVD